MYLHHGKRRMVHIPLSTRAAKKIAAYYKTMRRIGFSPALAREILEPTIYRVAGVGVIGDQRVTLVNF